MPKHPVIGQNAVVSQRKRLASGFPGERVIVLVLGGTALRSHTGVAHDVPGVGRNAVLHFVGRLGRLLDAQLVLLKEGNACGIRAAHFSGDAQGLDHLEPLGGGQVALIVQNSENCAHFTSPPQR